jgi:hypothetical protein
MRLQSIAFVAGGLLTWASGCGVFATGPSDQEVIAAVKQSPPLPPTVGPTYLAQIESVQVLERGRRDARGTYWPVRVRVRGGVNMALTNVFQLGFVVDHRKDPPIPVDFVEEARLSKDDFGKVRVSYSYDPRGPGWRLDELRAPERGR